jgi:hypothetical protein
VPEERRVVLKPGGPKCPKCKSEFITMTSIPSLKPGDPPTLKMDCHSCGESLYPRIGETLEQAFQKRTATP